MLDYGEFRGRKAIWSDNFDFEIDVGSEEDQCHDEIERGLGLRKKTFSF